MEEKKYYIVSRKHMSKYEQIFLLWGPNFSGYTTNVDKAGKYTVEEVRKSYGDDFPVVEKPIGYIDDEIDNFLIPDNEEALGKIGLTIKRVITYK